MRVGKCRALHASNQHPPASPCARIIFRRRHIAEHKKTAPALFLPVAVRCVSAKASFRSPRRVPLRVLLSFGPVVGTGGNRTGNLMDRRDRSVHRHPVAGSAKGFGQFRFRHVAGEIRTERSRSFRSADRGDVKPFVVRDQVLLAAPAGRIDQAEIAKGVGAGFATGSHFDITDVKACHCFNPCRSTCFHRAPSCRGVFRTAVFCGFFVLASGRFSLRF